MPWRTVTPVDERVRFVLDVERGDLPVSELCRVYGISRKTGYKWIGRFAAQGLEGMRERSRCPRSCPHRTSPQWQDRVIAERLRHPWWGPKKLRELFLDRHAADEVPAASTMGEILDRVGLTRRRRRRRRTGRPLAGRLSEARSPNEVWAADYKGWFRTGDGKRCDPLTVSDLHSRYVLEVRVLPDQSYRKALGVFTSLFRGFGMPRVIRVDNGSPFASTSAAGLSRLSVWWLLLGIQPEFIQPGHPEQNGVHERMHLTLKQETCTPPAGTPRGQQRRFTRWVREFNEDRPHEALGMARPVDRYEPSSRRFTGRWIEPTYPSDYVVRRVRSNGEIRWHGRKRFISEVLIGLPVGLHGTEPGRCTAYFGHVPLGELYETDSGGLRPTVSAPPNRQKEPENVLPMSPV